MNKQEIRKEWIIFFNTLTESQKRWSAAVKALEFGYGGISKVSQAVGISRTTISEGIKEVRGSKKLNLDNNRIRDVGGGRKRISSISVNILKPLEKILDESSAGDSMSLLKWTYKSSRAITEDLNKQGLKVGYKTIQKILKENGYSLQSNKKMLSGKNHPDRDSQFRHINRTVNRFMRNKNPVISVDTKKKELIGNFKNPGQVWTKKGEATRVLDHDFKSDGKGIAIPYGAYDLQRNEGFVNVGASSDTSEFAVNSIWQWWRQFGKKITSMPIKF